MKHFVLSLSAILAIGVSSCTKEKQVFAPRPDSIQNKQVVQTARNEFNVSAENSLLIFKTRADYERVVNQPTEELKSRFLETVNSLSGFKAANSMESLVQRSEPGQKGDDYFFSMLNTDHAIQIADHIFKIDLNKQTVYALPASEKSQYNDLVTENTANKNIRVFSTGDYVLDLIEHPEGNQKVETWWPFCSEDGCQGGHEISSIKSQPCEADYIKYGVYFSISAFVTTGDINVYRWDVEPVFYHARCGTTAGPYSMYNNPGSYSTRVRGQVFQSYQGSTPLNKILFRIRARYNGTNPVTYSEWMIIRHNY
jgi:hypothetical protein